MPAEYLSIILIVPVFLFSLCVHEYAHAWMATRLGDPTPEADGRLTMHPLAHADMVGTLILPSICLYFGMGFFGWAKPVQVKPAHFKRGRLDMAFVAAAGPLSNLFLALVSTGFLAWLVRMPIESAVGDASHMILLVMIKINLLLAIFNLIPLPPLDGFTVVEGFLPQKLLTKLQSVRRYSDLILVILLFSGGFQFAGLPADHLTRYLTRLAGAI